MKRIYSILFMCLVSMLGLQAQSVQQARQVLDKTAAIIGRKGGACAQFKISSSKFGSSTGTIAIKGNKFKATTPDAVVWYNGKTQWTYMSQTEEVNVTEPSSEQQAALNPYTFITMYKKGYNLSMQNKGANHIVTMKAQDTKKTIQQIVITINKQTSVPSQVKMLQGGQWTTITITGFEAKNQADGLFSFNRKTYPHAEVIDLR